MCPSYDIRFPRLLRGRFLERPNRFLGLVEIAGRTWRCLVPNSGRLRELLFPGNTVAVAPRTRGGRTTEGTVVLARADRLWVCVDTGAPNRLVGLLLRQGRIPELARYTAVTAEVSHGRSRLDFRLDGPDGPAWVEVKSVSLCTGGVARFPDAPTARGAKHLDELAVLSRRGEGAWLLLVCQRHDPRTFSPNYATDPAFARAFFDALAAGVRVLCLSTENTMRGIRLHGRVPVLGHPPEELYECGSYRLVIEAVTDILYGVPPYSGVRFPKGFYLYAGSGGRGLFRRVARHLRKEKRLHWHVDYLLQAEGVRVVDVGLFPPGIECALTREALSRPGARVVAKGFGAGDCRERCPAHLVHFERLPRQLGAR